MTTARGTLTLVHDSATTLPPFEPVGIDREDALAVATTPEAGARINDQADQAIERLGRGASIKAIIADALRAGIVYGYETALTEMRGGPVA